MSGIVDVRADDVLDAFLVDEALGSGDRRPRVIAIVDTHDLDAILLSVDLPAAIGVDHLGLGFSRVAID